MSILKAQLTNLAVHLTGNGQKLPKRLQTLAHLGKRLAPLPGHRRLLEQLEEAVDKNLPAIQLIAKIGESITPAFRRALVRLFVDHAWEGYKQRRKFYEETGLYPPNFIVISPLAACNLRCVGCYAGAYGHREPILTHEEIAKLVGEVRSWGTRFITISGGEPLLLWEKIPGSDKGLRDLAREYNDMVFLMYTNGTLINEAMAAEMAELGNVSPAISIEGFQEETDARRGAGTFDKIMRAMDILREHKVLFGGSVTYTARNVDTVTSDQFIQLLIDKGCLYVWYFMYVPVGRDPDLSLMVTPEQRRHVALKTYEWLTTRPIFVADFWNSGPLVGGCIAAGRPNGYLHVNHRGDITPCVFMMYSAHNIHEMDTDTPLREALCSDFFRKLREGQARVEDNPLAPCLIVDHPEVLKEAVETTGAQSTQEGQTVLTTLHPALCERARQWQAIADELWETGQVYRGMRPHYHEGKLGANLVAAAAQKEETAARH